MQKIAFDIEAGDVSAELDRRGTAAGTRVHPPAWLAALQACFFNVFGFGQVTASIASS
jgi:hypothetical protein